MLNNVAQPELPERRLGNIFEDGLNRIIYARMSSNGEEGPQKDIKKQV